MFNSDFYPTPTDVIKIMLAPYSSDFLQSKRILEPSAGKGDLCDALVSLRGVFPSRITCVEVEPELCATLRGKGYQTREENFLTAEFGTTDRFDLIIMNPPFSDGAKHILRAWELLSDGGHVVCLLNKNTVMLRSDRYRRLVSSLVEQHGQVFGLGSCFSGMDAFRKTNVDVSLVTLTKPIKKSSATWTFQSADLGIDPERSFKRPDLENQLERPNVIKNLILRHNKAAEAIVDLVNALADIKFYALDRMYQSELFKTISYCDEDDAVRKGLAMLTKDSWNAVFEMSKFSDLASSTVRRDFDQFREENKGLSFTEENIAKIFDSLYASRNDVLQQCILDVFDFMTAYHKENRIHVEGWKSNEAWKVSRKVILPGLLDYHLLEWDKAAGISYTRRDNVDDIDRALCFLSGKKLENVLTIVKALEQNNKEDKANWNKRSFESEFFECRAYKKNTIHLKFKDEYLWERFNIEAARGKHWLPDDYQHRAKAADKFAVALR